MVSVLVWFQCWFGFNIGVVSVPVCRSKVGQIIDAIRLSIKMSVEINEIKYSIKSSSKSNLNCRFPQTAFSSLTAFLNHYLNSTFKSKTSFIVMGFQYVVLNKEKKMGRIRTLKNISKGLLRFWLEVMAYYGSS